MARRTSSSDAATTVAAASNATANPTIHAVGVADQQLRMPGSRSYLLQLPPELQHYLSRFLDLGSLITYTSSVCKPLRHLFGSFEPTSLYLFPSHRLSLAEWRTAALSLRRDGRGGGDAGVGATLAPIEPECQAFETALNWDVSRSDLTFLLKVLNFLGGGRFNGDGRQAASAESTCAAPRMAGITSLSLISWHGLAAKDLIELLQTHPMLSNVQILVKTEHLDGQAWREATMANASPYNARSDTTERLSDRPKVDCLSERRWTTFKYLERISSFPFNSCTKTQAILQVGKRRTTRPGERLLKGEGLQIGFEGLCLEQTPVGGAAAKEEEGEADAASPDQRFNSNVAVTETASAKAPRHLGAEAGADGLPVKARLHIVLQGRYQDAGEDSLEVDELFVRSVVRCNHCKQRLAF
ncbi:hypothetical protein ACQY0O_004337 [Thecaphora frezii]